MEIESDVHRWTIRFGGNRYDLAFADGALRNIYFGPDFTGPVVTIPDHHQNFDQLRETRPEAAVFVGPNRDRVLWDSAVAERRSDGLAITLTAAHLSADLNFIFDDATGSLRRTTTLRASSADPVDLRGALSVSVLAAEPVRRMTYLTGAWGHETQVRSIEPDFSSLLLESRSGKTGFEFQPYIALETGNGTCVVELLWSGNWHLHARTRKSDAILAGGLPETGFDVRLEPGETLELPEALVVRVAGDLNAATQRLHDLRRRLQSGNIARVPVQFNSWYPYSGDPTAPAMIALADVARDLGCEVFVLDGGWYSNDAEPQSDDLWHSTGDWAVHKGRFPNGLEELADHCRQIGIAFGLWFEPESIGAEAQLRRTHPEWMHWIHGRPPDPHKRAVLNLGIPAAREWVRDRMLEILGRTGASWLKWDFNADLVSGGWPPDAPDDLLRRDPVIEHVRGIYRLQQEIREAMPGLVLEMCASGGGRFDGALLRRAHVNWMSDQWQAVKNLAIHFGSHLAHPASLCNDWLIDWPRPPAGTREKSDPSLEWRWDERGDLRFRLRVAMLGSFGLSSKLDLWSDAEIATARQHIEWYKLNARELISDGDQYLLTAPPPLSGDGDWAAVWYAAKDARRGVGYFFRLEGKDARKHVSLPGLALDAVYEVAFLDGGSERQSGRQLAEGLSVRIEEPFGSAAVAVTQVSEAP
jgi:alpha-galactosidase